MLKKIITKLSRTNYINIVRDVGLDGIVIPKRITTNKILKFTRGADLQSLRRILEGKVEILEFVVDNSSKIINKEIRKLNISSNTVIATIVRKQEVVVPHGNDIIRSGDRIIVITMEANISTLRELESAVIGGNQNELRNGIKKLGKIISM